VADGKETKRERRDAARHARMEAQRRAAKRRTMRKVWVSVIALVIVGGIVAAVMVSGGNRGALVAEVDELAASAGCSEVQNLPVEGREHIQPPEIVEYDTNPPTSGNHYGNWGNTGVYTTPLQDEIQVHNLEHGHVIVQYTTDLDVETVELLEGVVGEDDAWSIIAPRPGMDVPLAFTAWQSLSRCDAPGDSGAVEGFARDFIAAYKQKGPETIPGTPQ